MLLCGPAWLYPGTQRLYGSGLCLCTCQEIILDLVRENSADGATNTPAPVNADWDATSGLAQILNKPTKVSAFENDSGYLTSHQSLANYALKTDIPTVTTYTAGQGIKIENGVISVIERTKVGKPTCPGYTLYGDYFLSNTVIPNKNWEEADSMTEDVTVTQNYNYGSAETKAVVAYTLSKAELETLTTEQRKINDNNRVWYWTSTPSYGTYAWNVNNNGDFNNNITNNNDNGGARLGMLITLLE